MHLTFRMVLLCIHLLVNNFSCDGEPLIMTKSGPVKGYRAESLKGNLYFGFRGIPYALPPVNWLRFKAPVKFGKWKGVFDGTQESGPCPQISMGNVVGQEDCLQLNVYTPKFDNKTEPLPVMVWFHAGGFTVGSGAHFFVGPQNFMDFPVVLVTFNYRLGALGFLSTGDKNAPGNFAMLDQVMVLQWVHDNIANFGGDSNKVTIFGNSAGAASVMYHMLSPLSTGLFHRAIIQSGSVLSPWALNRDPLSWATKFAERLNCSNSNDTKHIVQCLSEVPVENLLLETHKVRKGFVFPCDLTPVIESKCGSGFLTEDPVKLIKEGRIVNKVPLIIGRVIDEGYSLYNVFAANIKTPGKQYYKKEFASDLQWLRPVSNFTKAIQAITQKYVKNADVDKPEIFEAVNIQIFSDALFSADVSHAVELLSKHGLDVYAYIYNYLGQFCTAQFFNGKCGKHISHADERLLQFRMANLVITQPNDIKMANTINSLWTKFANNSNLVIPNGKKWPLYNVSNPRYVDLSLEPNIKHGIIAENMTFWTETIDSL